MISFDLTGSGKLCSLAEPLDLDNEHEIIGRINQERNETLVVLAEMQRAK